MRTSQKFLVRSALLILLLGLCSCERYPAEAVDGTPWDKNWTMLGSVLGVESPGNGFTLQDNNLAMAANDSYLATWTSGEPKEFVKEDGTDAEYYDARIYLLVLSMDDNTVAGEMVQDWIDSEYETYTVLDTFDQTCNGQDYTFMTYETINETNPYDRGVVAFTTYENYALTIELSCIDSYTGDETEILTDLLNGFHYSADLAPAAS